MKVKVTIEWESPVNEWEKDIWNELKTIFERMRNDASMVVELDRGN